MNIIAIINTATIINIIIVINNITTNTALAFNFPHSCDIIPVTITSLM